MGFTEENAKEANDDILKDIIKMLKN